MAQFHTAPLVPNLAQLSILIGFEHGKYMVKKILAGFGCISCIIPKLKEVASLFKFILRGTSTLPKRSGPAQCFSDRRSP